MGTAAASAAQPQRVLGFEVVTCYPTGVEQYFSFPFLLACCVLLRPHLPLLKHILNITRQRHNTFLLAASGEGGRSLLLSLGAVPSALKCAVGCGDTGRLPLREGPKQSLRC